jgi:hypothetical protein
MATLYGAVAVRVEAHSTRQSRNRLPSVAHPFSWLPGPLRLDHHAIPQWFPDRKRGTIAVGVLGGWAVAVADVFLGHENLEELRAALLRCSADADVFYWAHDPAAGLIGFELFLGGTAARSRWEAGGEVLERFGDPIAGEPARLDEAGLSRLLDLYVAPLEEVLRACHTVYTVDSSREASRHTGQWWRRLTQMVLGPHPPVRSRRLPSRLVNWLGTGRPG